MKRIATAVYAVLGALAAACAAKPSHAPAAAEQAALPNGSATDAMLVVPTGSLLTPAGFLTIEQAPDSPAPEPVVSPPRSESTYYAELAGVSNEEAEKRLAAQEALRLEFERLLRTLRDREKGNYTDAELIHRPDWAYLLFFKREPERTLAKYTRNPRFQARLARYTGEELQTLSAPWIERLQKERLFTGYGINARDGRVDIEMVVDETEFARIADRNGWDVPPDYLSLKFERAPAGPVVDPALSDRIRIFPQSDRNLGIHHQAAYYGRIVLRDGCFLVVDGTPAQTSHLAYFPREVGLYMDSQGYLALRTRSAEPRHLGRIGEDFVWAGPIAVGEDAPMVRELRERCGSAPLMHVAIPDSRAIFEARYPHTREPVSPPPPPPVQPQL